MGHELLTFVIVLRLFLQLMANLNVDIEVDIELCVIRYKDMRQVLLKCQ